MDEYLLKNKRLLVGVSGGSDSMALLHWLLSKQASYQFDIGVAHINHHLRKEADQDALFVEKYCQEHNLPFYIGHWTPTKTHVEEEARKFRYSFFNQILVTEQYDVLCTAHHRNDRIETALRRLISGYHLWDIDGLKEERFFNGHRLLRPLIDWTKEDIHTYCQQHAIAYVEDESNYDLKYERNRIRHQWLPLFQAENPRFLETFVRFLDQLNQENSYQKEIEKQRLRQSWDGQKFHLQDWQETTVWLFCQYLISDLHIEMTQEKAQLIQRLCRTKTGTKKIQLNSELLLVREYDFLRLQLCETVEKTSEEVYTLDVNRGFFLSENEWIGYYDHRPVLPEDSDWKMICWRQPAESLILRHPQAGDSFVFNANGNQKKVNRLLIDQKIPQEKRSKLWVLCNEEGRVRGVLPLRQAYLSNHSETDKMNYIIYYYKIE